MAIRLIALDIDGTLLDSSSQLPEENIRAVAAARERGIEVMLVTGRRFDFAMPVARQFGCPLTLIVNNGAVVKSSGGETHMRHLLPRQTALDVLRLTPAFAQHATIVFDRPCANQVVYENIDWSDPQRRDYFERNRQFMARVSPLEHSLTEDPIQVMYSGCIADMGLAEASLRSIQAEVPFSLAVTYYESRDFGLVDVVGLHCSKGATLAKWAAQLGVKREEVMAIGDNFNDREMLEYAGLPIVMGNSIPELKAFGWLETLSNDEGGVAAAIEIHALGQQEAAASGRLER